MTIELTPDLEKLVESEMQSGDYSSPTEVITRALRFFGEFHQQPLDIPNMAALLEEGERDLDAGRVQDADEVFEELYADIRSFEIASKK
jgi:putative addiction module CopG family antidote